jgi:hypothetical protein
MAPLLVAIGCGLALWKLVELLRLGWQALNRALTRWSQSLCARVRALAAWRIRKASAHARVRDYRDKGQLRLQAETIAALTHQLARMQERIDELAGRGFTQSPSTDVHDRTLRDCASR